jgi:hypothetical protein
VLPPIGYGFSSSEPIASSQVATQDEEREAKRQALLELARKDLTKEVHELLAEVHHEAGTIVNWQVTPIMRTTAKLASLQGALAIKADIQTKRIVRLTWGLFWLTVALVLLTAGLFSLTGYLVYDSYLNRQRNEEKQSHGAKPNQTDTEIHPVTTLY